MSTITKPIALDETMQAIKLSLDNINSTLQVTGGDYSWEQVREIVANGHGATAFPVGHQFSVEHETYGTIIFDVVGHDQVASATGKQHTMTLLAHNCIANVQVDADGEAFYYCATELAIGTYHFTVPTTYGATVAGTYEFTTTVKVPAGGQLCFSGNPYSTAVTSLTVVAYTTKGGTTEVWASAARPVITAGNSGTDLGSLDSTLNHIRRICWGSNNYEQSAIRQFLNSEAAAGTYWTAKTKFDRAPSWNATLAGFMKGLPVNFKGVVDTAVVKCSTNNTYESPDSAHAKNTAYTLSDKFFLASRMEVFNSSDVVDGSVLMSYFIDATNDDRIKLLNGAARYWWLRTPHSNVAPNPRDVGPDGSLSNGDADNSLGCVPACIIG